MDEGVPDKHQLDGTDQSSELEKREAEITSEVPIHFDDMNWAAGDINALETQMGQAEERHRRWLAQWGRAYEDAKAQCGDHLQKARPYFDHLRLLNERSRRAQNCTRRFSAAAARLQEARGDLRELEKFIEDDKGKGCLDQSQQDNLSRATMRLMRCQSEWNDADKEHSRALTLYEQALAADECLRKKVGPKSIRKAKPFYEQLEATQTQLVFEQHRIQALEERIRDSKALYSGSMKELDRISCRVHSIRSEYAARCSAAIKTADHCEPETEP